MGKLALAADRPGMKPWNKTAKAEKQNCQESQAVYRMKTGVQVGTVSHMTQPRVFGEHEAACQHSSVHF